MGSGDLSARIHKRIQAILVVGRYQPWRTVKHCASPEPRRFLQSGIRKTLENRLSGLLFGVLLEARKAGSPFKVFQPSQTQEIT
jgi:hypothetical protein